MPAMSPALILFLGVLFRPSTGTAYDYDYDYDYDDSATDTTAAAAASSAAATAATAVVPLFSKGDSFGDNSLTRADFNARVHSALAGADEHREVIVIRRECARCSSQHHDVYYKRLTDKTTFDAYGLLLETWSSTNNALNTDFELYSSLRDAANNRSAWNFCNYDDPGVAFPRDCGPSDSVGGQWNSFTRGGQSDVRFTLVTITTAMLEPEPEPEYQPGADGFEFDDGSDDDARSDDDAVPGCPTTNGGAACVFPFVYEGIAYRSCTKVNNHGELWCATTSSYDADRRWGGCDLERDHHRLCLPAPVPAPPEPPWPEPESCDPDTQSCELVCGGAAVAHGADYAEQSFGEHGWGDDGDMYLGSSDLELFSDRGEQIVAIRFEALDIPQGAQVTRASITLVTDEPGEGVVVARITPELSALPAPFSDSPFNLSRRLPTPCFDGLCKSVRWVPEQDTLGEHELHRESVYRTPGGWSCMGGDAITDLDACKASAVHLAHRFTRVVVDSSGGRPLGCFWDKNGGVYFNEASTSAADPASQRAYSGTGGICRRRRFPLAEVATLVDRPSSSAAPAGSHLFRHDVWITRADASHRPDVFLAAAPGCPAGQDLWLHKAATGDVSGEMVGPFTISGCDSEFTDAAGEQLYHITFEQDATAGNMVNFRAGDKLYLPMGRHTQTSDLSDLVSQLAGLPGWDRSANAPTFLFQRDAGAMEWGSGKRTYDSHSAAIQLSAEYCVFAPVPPTAEPTTEPTLDPVCRTTTGGACVFPFVYDGHTYSSCTGVDNSGTPWCSKTADYDADGEWGECNFDMSVCPEPTETPTASPTPDLSCEPGSDGCALQCGFTHTAFARGTAEQSVGEHGWGADGEMYLCSSDLELFDDSGEQLVGIQFETIGLPSMAKVERAIISLHPDSSDCEDDSGEVGALIMSEPKVSPPKFSTNTFDLSQRKSGREFSGVTWKLPKCGASGAISSPDVSALLNELTASGDWSKDSNAATFVLERAYGSGRRWLSARHDGIRFDIEYCKHWRGTATPSAEPTAEPTPAPSPEPEPAECAMPAAVTFDFTTAHLSESGSGSGEESAADATVIDLLSPVPWMSTSKGSVARAPIKLVTMSRGGAACEPQYFEGAAGLRFTAGEGFYIDNIGDVLGGADSSSDYAVAITFRFDNEGQTSYKRVLNTLHGEDDGLYIEGGGVRPYPHPNHLVFDVRDGRYQTMVVSYERAANALTVAVQEEGSVDFQQYTWEQVNEAFRLHTDRPMLFFNDYGVDNCGGGEHGNGHIKRLQVFSRALDTDELKRVARFGPICDPSTTSTTATGTTATGTTATGTTATGTTATTATSTTATTATGTTASTVTERAAPPVTLPPLTVATGGGLGGGDLGSTGAGGGDGEPAPDTSNPLTTQQATTEAAAVTPQATDVVADPGDQTGGGIGLRPTSDVDLVLSVLQHVPPENASGYNVVRDYAVGNTENFDIITKGYIAAAAEEGLAVQSARLTEVLGLLAAIQADTGEDLSASEAVAEASVGGNSDARDDQTASGASSSSMIGAVVGTLCLVGLVAGVVLVRKKQQGNATVSRARTRSAPPADVECGTAMPRAPRAEPKTHTMDSGVSFCPTEFAESNDGSLRFQSVRRVNPLAQSRQSRRSYLVPAASLGPAPASYSSVSEVTKIRVLSAPAKAEDLYDTCAGLEAGGNAGAQDHAGAEEYESAYSCGTAAEAAPNGRAAVGAGPLRAAPPAGCAAVDYALADDQVHQAPQMNDYALAAEMASVAMEAECEYALASQEPAADASFVRPEIDGATCELATDDARAPAVGVLDTCALAGDSHTV